jgi:hypothetical protein
MSRNYRNTLNSLCIELILLLPTYHVVIRVFMEMIQTIKYKS